MFPGPILGTIKLDICLKSKGWYNGDFEIECSEDLLFYFIITIPQKYPQESYLGFISPIFVGHKIMALDGSMGYP